MAATMVFFFVLIGLLCPPSVVVGWHSSLIGFRLHRGRSPCCRLFSSNDFYDSSNIGGDWDQSRRYDDERYYSNSLSGYDRSTDGSDNYYYNAPPSPPPRQQQQQQYHAAQDYYSSPPSEKQQPDDSNVYYKSKHVQEDEDYYMDHGEPYDDRRAYMDPRLTEEYATPDYGRYDDALQGQEGNQPYHYNNQYPGDSVMMTKRQQQQRSPPARRRIVDSYSYDGSMDLFDDFWEETQSIFNSIGMMSPFFGFGRRRAMSPWSLMEGSPWTLPSHFMAPSTASNALRSTMMMMNQSQRRVFSIESILDEAQRYLNLDPVCVEALGRPIKIGRIISQSSSSSSINGQTKSSTQLLLSAEGSHDPPSSGSGRVQLYATDQGIQQMILQVEDGRGDFREINVQLSDAGADSQVRNSEVVEGIVDAEIID